MSDHERIWLEPECCVDPAQGRLWCQDKAWIDDDCQMEPTEYVRADIAAAEIARLRARVAELEAALKQAGQWFHEYGVSHHAKGATEKAERNIERSQFCINAALKGRAGNTLDGRQHLEWPA